MLEKIIDVVKIALEKYLIPAIGAIAVAILLLYFTPENFDVYIEEIKEMDLE